MSIEPSNNELPSNPRPRSIILPVFEIDCSGWLADTVPQECSPVFQRSVLLGLDNDGVSENGASDPVTGQDVSADLANESLGTSPISRSMAMIDRDLHNALSELAQEENRTRDLETEKLLRATAQDLLAMRKSLDAARSRLKTLPK